MADRNNMTMKLRKPPKATIHVTVIMLPEFRFRLWLALKLITLAAWVLDWGIEVTDDTT